MTKKLFAAIIALLTFVTIISTSASALSASNFRDVSPNAWYYEAVDYAASEGLFSGTSSNTFSPNEPMTRGMFVKVLGNKAKIDTSAFPGSSFTDVSAGAWYAPCVEWAAKNVIVNGVGSGKFAPERSVTREQMAVILYNYARYAGCDTMAQVGVLVKFSDNCKVSTYARHAMEWAVTHGLLSGSGGRLDPQGTATRAQVAQIFYNSRDFLVETGTETPDPTPAPVPTPTPAPAVPKIPITDEVRAKLKPNQDPDKLLDYVTNGKNDDPYFSYDGTTAKWDPDLPDSNGVAKNYFGSWDDIEHEMRSSSMIANGFIQILTRTVSDRFYITAEDEDGCFCLYYHPVDNSDSERMQAVKAGLRLPSSKRYDSGLRYEGTGWAGPMEWGAYNGAEGIAKKIEFYMMDMHPDAKRYCITEPAPGIFYLLYSYGN